MRSRRRRLPQGARAAARVVKLLGASGTITLLPVCMVIAFCSVGVYYVDMQTGNTACQLPEQAGSQGVAVFGDRALTGLATALPGTLAGGKVRNDVQAGRTAQQGENALIARRDSAPGIFVLSLEQNDASDIASYTARIDELMVLLSGRTVFWVTVPGKNTLTKIVETENRGNGGQSDDQTSWHIVDFAAAVTTHSDWWSAGKPTRAGLKNLARTISGQIPAGGNGGRAAAGTGPTAGITVTSTTNASDSFALTGERIANAKTIVAVGSREGIPQSPGVLQRAEVIAMATAIQESKLINLKGGPGDAYGLFQQTPPGWGTVAQVENPTYAATQFYRHLFHLPGWQNMSVTDAAQAVQRSAYPDAYAQWGQSANVIVAALTGQHATGCGPQVVAGSAKAQIAVNATLSQLGVPYSFAGGNKQGPTLGSCMLGTSGLNDCTIVGFDCSGLMLYAWGKAGVAVPHFTNAMWTDPDFVHITHKSQLLPGDMMMFEGPPPGHTGMYIGNGKLVDAPHSGAVVQLESVDDPWYASTYVGALRPKV